MRCPSYRAWIPQINRIVKVFGMEWGDDGEKKTCVVHVPVPHDFHVSCPPAILMESTHLKDKNGKEIFEGDIIQIESATETVEWSELFCGWSPFAPALPEMGSAQMCADKVVIIGNIHEGL